MKNLLGILALLLLVQSAGAQQSLNGIRLQDANGHVVTIGAPTSGFTGSYSFRFPAGLPAAGSLMYAGDGEGQSTWLPSGADGQVLSFSGGLPVWTTLTTLLSGLIEWDMTGNAVLLAYNGLIGSYLGTNNGQPLVLGTTSILSPQPIKFYTANSEKMRLTSGGELGIGLTPTAGKLLHVGGTSGTSNVRLASLGSATGTTGRVMFATDATGDIQSLAFPGSAGQILTSSTTGVLSWTTPATGSVTSVGVTVPSILSVAPATITTSGTFAITLANQATGNQIFASPNGASGVPAFRSMSLADLPSIASNTILGNNTAGAAAPSALTAAQVKTLLNLTGTNSGDVTLAGTGTYLSLAGQAITQNPIDLSSANATGILAAARHPALSGDVTSIAGTLATTIAANAVTYAKLQNTTAASILLGRNSTGAGAIGEITLGAGLSMSATGVLSASGFMSNALTNNHIFVGNSNGIATDVAMSGDVAIVATGATTIQPAAVSLSKMANLAANSIIGNNTGLSATPVALTAAQVKTMLSLNNVENTALSTWAGSANLTTLGTITSGTWNGTQIGPTFGGTGQTTYTTGDILYASAANTLSKLPIGAANTVLTVSGGIPTWASIGATNWQLAGNSVTTGYNGTTGSFIGTTNTQPLVLATTNTATPQPIDFYTNNAVKMRLNANGFLSLGGNFTPNSPMHIRSSNANSSALYLENTATNGYTSVDFKNDVGTVGNMGVSNSAASAFPGQYYFNISAGSVLPITFNQNTNEKMAIDLNGNTYIVNNLGVGFTSSTYATLESAGRAFNVAGTSGTVNVRMSSLASATPATTGGVLYANSNGDLNRLAAPASSGQVLSSTIGGTFSWATALTIPLLNTTSSASTLFDLTNSGSGSVISATASGATSDGSFAVLGTTSAAAASAGTEMMGVWGLASSTNATSTATIGVRAEGNGTTTDSKSNIGLEVLNGEFVVARQASSAANDNSGANNIIVSGDDDANGVNDQGPSGIVDIQDGGNPGGSSTSIGTLQVFNRYAKSHSIILITPMAGGTGADGPDESTTYRISARANGSFTVEVRRLHAGGANGTSGTWRVGFLIVNPGK